MNCIRSASSYFVPVRCNVVSAVKVSVTKAAVRIDRLIGGAKSVAAVLTVNRISCRSLFACP